MIKVVDFYLYDRIGKNLNKIYLLNDEKVKISIKNIPLLGYLLFYKIVMRYANK